MRPSNREVAARRLGGCIYRFCKKNSVVILGVAAIAGLGATAYAVAKAVPKAQKSLEKAKEEKGEELTKVEEVEAVAKDYILPAAFGVATSACIVGMILSSKNREAQLVSAYGLVSNGFQAYREKLIELKGPEVDIEVRDALAREHCDFHIIGLERPDEKVLWYDELSGQTIRAYEREVMDAEYHLNRNFVMRGYATLNEFYTFIGMKPTKEGECLGWSASDGYYWIDIQHRRIDNPDEGGEPMYAVEFIFSPDESWMEDWGYTPLDVEKVDLPWDEPVKA